MKITAQADDSKNERFTITNTGSTTLTFDLSTEGEFRDDDYDSIDLLFSDVEALAPGDSVEVILTADIDRMVDVGIYDGLVKVASNGIEEEISLAVEVQPKMCKYGVIGDLEVAIQEPDDNEEFTPGETIQADIRVDNHYSKDMDVIVELVLYDATDNEEIESVTSEDEEVDDGKAETFDLEFEIPTSDLDEDNEYYLYAMAYKKNDEEEHCIFDRVKLDLERGEDNVIVKEIDLNKNEYSCGDTVLVDVDVENIGTDDQEQVYVLLKSRDLGVELKSDKFDLDEYDDIDSKYTVSFEFELPSNVDADEYYLQAYVNYADNDLNSEFVKLVVNEDACAVQEITEPKLVLTPVESTITVKPGVLKFVIPLKLENIGGSPITFEIDVSDVSGWADVIGIEGPETLNANELYHAYVYMQLKGEVAEGVHNLRVNLRDANGLIQSKMLSVEVQDGTITTVTDEQNVAWLSGILSDKSKLFWFIGDAILIIVALLFIRMLLRR